MGKQILITGGAGFIGSHLASELLDHGYAVRVLDNLSPQVHGPERKRPAYLNPDVELVVGDVRDYDAVKHALKGIDAIYHFAAAVGVGQSMYKIATYTDTNNLGTSVLLQVLIDQPVERLIVASSMSIYGEGMYRLEDGTLVEGKERPIDQLRKGVWEISDEHGLPMQPVPTPETKSASLSSVYALSKFDQERLCMIVGGAYGIPTVALRFFNAYGTHQALANPYTGVLAIFASRLLNGNGPMIFEDGRQRRDFVSVLDVARACRLALESDAAAGQAFNVGSGQSCSVTEIAVRMARIIGKPHLQPEITGSFRAGDIRHCFADIAQARRVLGYEPQVDLERGLEQLAHWLQGQRPLDNVEKAREELLVRGLSA